MNPHTLGRWRKIYTRPSQSFMLLDEDTRGTALNLIQMFDDRGRLDFGDRPEFEALCLLLQVRRAKRPRFREKIEELVRDGFLVREPGALLIRNFDVAQTAISASGERMSRLRERARARNLTEGASAEQAPATARKHSTALRHSDASVTVAAPSKHRRSTVEAPKEHGRSTEGASAEQAPATARKHSTALRHSDASVTVEVEVEEEEEKKGVASLPPARVPARATPPQPLEPERDPRQPLVRALADGAGELWSNDGEPWRRSALEEALAKHDFDEDEARSFGRFLRRTGVAESLKTQRVSPYWFVFGGSPGSAEFRHLDAAVKAFDRWCDAEEARLKSAAEQRQKQHARNEKSASPPVRSAEAVSAAARKALEEFKRLPKPITARSSDDEQPGEIEDEPNTTGAEQRGEESLGAVLEGILGARTNAKASLPIEALGSGESGAPDRPPVRPGARPAPDGDPGRPLARSPASSGNHGAPGASAGHQPSPALTADEDEQPPDLRRRQGGRAPAEGTEPNATGGEQLHTEETHP